MHIICLMNYRLRSIEPVTSKENIPAHKKTGYDLHDRRNRKTLYLSTFTHTHKRITTRYNSIHARYKYIATQQEMIGL